MGVSVAALLFKTHYGKETDVASLATWLEELERNIPSMWNGDNSQVKDYRAAEDFFNLVLDAYIIATLSDCHFPGQQNIEHFAARLPSLSDDTIKEGIEKTAIYLSNFGVVSKMRKRSNRDVVEENVVLFLQQGLVFRNALLAMRQGDSGRVVNSLIYFTAWFQGSGKFNYASETLRLVACLRKLWSDDLVEFWLDNCLINISGKREAFLACDMLNEYVVREVKAMMQPNVTPASDEYLRRNLSLLVMYFRELRRCFSDQLESNDKDFHSSKVNPWKDIEVIVNRMLKDGICTHTEGREARDAEARDLFMEGLKELGVGNGVANLRSSILAERTVPDEVQDKRIVTGMAALPEECGRNSGEESEDDDGDGGDGGDDEYRDRREVFGDTDILNDREWSS
jgi:hypothetical protein